MSQEDVAAQIDADRSTISRVERGESPYDQDILEKLAAVYRCDPEDLISTNPFREDSLYLLWSSLRQAPVEVRARALGYIEALLKAD
jgi:transcriptional regulator with XRE-family HTH domain